MATTKTKKAKKAKKDTTATELAVHPGERSTVVLPGEAAVDEALVAQAVQEINAIHSAKGLETARAIGEYVLAKFFNGDLDHAQKKHGKHMSFTALAEHDDLAVGRSTLWYSVSLLGQLRELPDDIAGSLPFSHHKLLLTVKDPEKKLELAKEAVTTGVGKREFEDRVREVRGERWADGGKPGRQALPPWAKRIGGIERVVESAMAGELTVDEVVRHGTGKVEERLAEVNAAIERLEDFRASLTEALDGANTALDEMVEKAAAS